MKYWISFWEFFVQLLCSLGRSVCGTEFRLEPVVKRIKNTVVPSGEQKTGHSGLVPGFPKPAVPFKTIPAPSQQSELPQPWGMQYRYLNAGAQGYWLTVLSIFRLR